MNIPFKQIPTNLRVPLFFAELDNSMANSSSQNQRALIIGQITSAGIAPPNVPLISQGAGDAIIQGGAGSMLALMTAAYRLADNFGEVWYLPLADAGGSTAAAGSLNFTSPATVNGVLSLYIGGTLISQPILTTQTTAQIASALVATINATPNLPVLATVDGSITSKVDLTALNAGPGGNDIDLRLNYRGSLGGEALPVGLAVTIITMTGGATPPVLTTALANLSDMPFDFIVLPYTDTTSLNALQTFLSDVGGRWGWSTQIFGHVFTAYRGTFGAQTTLGTARNDQHASIMGFYDSPTPNWIWAATLAGRAAGSLRADPAMPLQTLSLPGVLAPPLQSRFPLTERNTLLWDGISTFTVADDGTVAIENLITTYQKNGFGQADNSYLQVETMFSLEALIQALATVITSKYARVKLASNGTRVTAGSGIVTPDTIRTDLIAKYYELQAAGLVQNADAFAANIIVQQNVSNPNRVDVLYPATLIDQLRVFATLVQFRLS